MAEVNNRKRITLLVPENHRRQGTAARHFHHTAYNIAAAYAALQELDEAVNWLEAAADDGFPCCPYFERDPKLDTLRRHPQFVALMSLLYKQWQQFKQMASTAPPAGNRAAGIRL